MNIKGNTYRNILADDSSCGPIDNGSNPPSYFDIEKAFFSGQCSDTYAYHREEQITTLAAIPDKTDGLVSPNFATWNKSDPYPTAFRTGNGNGNFYYYDRDGHGYNHYELRRTTRAYTEGGKFGIVTSSTMGAPSLPMFETRNWVIDQINNP